MEGEGEARAKGKATANIVFTGDEDKTGICKGQSAKTFLKLTDKK